MTLVEIFRPYQEIHIENHYFYKHYMAVIAVINILTNGNYMFLCHAEQSFNHGLPGPMALVYLGARRHRSCHHVYPVYSYLKIFRRIKLQSLFRFQGGFLKAGHEQALLPVIIILLSLSSQAARDHCFPSLYARRFPPEISSIRATWLSSNSSKLQFYIVKLQPFFCISFFHDFPDSSGIRQCTVFLPVIIPSISGHLPLSGVISLSSFKVTSTYIQWVPSLQYSP